MFSPSLVRGKVSKIRKLRQLPRVGQILVSVGDTVGARQMVGETELPGDIVLVRTVEELGIDPLSALKAIKVKQGDRVVSGQVLARHQGLWGLFTSECLSPIDGTIDFVSRQTAHIGIRQPSKHVQLNAFIDGIVSELVDRQSATIEGIGVLVQGVFGFGTERVGVLNVLPITPSQPLDETVLTFVQRGQIVVGGSYPTIEFLRKAEQKGVVGIVCGSIDDCVMEEFLQQEIRVAVTGDEKVDFSLFITEGFGAEAMGEDIVAALKAFQNSPASISGITQVRAGAVRPELIVALKDQTVVLDSLSANGGSLVVGAKVRIVRDPYNGAVGEIAEILSKEMQFPNEIWGRGVMIRLRTGQEVIVLRQNLEILDNCSGNA